MMSFLGRESGCVCASSRDGVGRSPGNIDTELWLTEAQPPSHTMLCKQLSIVIPRQSSSRPQQIRSYYPRTMGGLRYFSFCDRGKADNKSIYVTLRLFRGLIFINRLIFSSNNPFMRWYPEPRSSDKELRLLLIHGTLGP